MSKIISFSIVMSFLGLWIKNFMSHDLQTIVGFLLVFSFGILHGANDLMLIQKTLPNKKNNTTIQILALYLFFVGLGILLFYLFPFFSLLLFILVSGYHFGEQHWQLDCPDRKKRFLVFFQTAYGLLVLSILFLFHPLEVDQIIFNISDWNIPFDWLRYFFYGTVFATLLGGIILYVSKIKWKKPLFQELILFLVFSILFKTSSLIWGFALYFVIWHSIPSMLDQIQFLHGSVSIQKCWLYLKSGFLIWLISIIGILTLYYFFNQHYFFEALFFSFLAAITFPHVWVIIQMFKRKKTL